MRIALIEDDAILQRELKAALENEGYVVDVSGDGEEGLHLVLDFPIDMAIVDLGLPQLSGLELIETARDKGCEVPILILTARNGWQEKVRGLEAGADDYVAKPFDMPELLARLRALLRRKGGWAKSTLRCGPISLNPSSQHVSRCEETVKLTSLEYKVLYYLMQHAGEVISKTRLQAHIYDDTRDPESNVLEVFIRRLRKKLDPDGDLDPIETIRGEGYRFKLERT